MVKIPHLKWLTTFVLKTVGNSTSVPNISTPSHPYFERYRENNILFTVNESSELFPKLWNLFYVQRKQVNMLYDNEM